MPVHSLVEQATIVEVYAGTCRTPLGQERGAEIAHGTPHRPEIVPQGSLDQAGQCLAVLRGTCLGFANQAVIEVQGRPHTEICTLSAVRVNVLDDPACIFAAIVMHLLVWPAVAVPTIKGETCIPDNRKELDMKNIAVVLAVAAFAAVTGAAVAQTRDDIMDRVIWPCVGHEVEELDLEEHHAEAASTIMFELDRDYYEDVVDAVEEALAMHAGDPEDWVYEAGLAACIQNQGRVAGRKRMIRFAAGLPTSASSADWTWRRAGEAERRLRRRSR